MRVFKREILRQVYPLPDGLNLTPVMSTRALHEGVRIKEVRSLTASGWSFKVKRHSGWQHLHAKHALDGAVL